jgi:diguanylate cyclase (GGDEF)-like protein/PAS domain S-box-containing protein
MPDARLGLVRNALATAPPGEDGDFGDSEVPDAGDDAGVAGAPGTPERLALLSGLAGVATWELTVPGPVLQWHSRFESIVRNPPAGGRYRVPAGPHGRAVELDELGDVLLGPIVETASAGVVWDNYELIQEMEDPGGVVHRILVRATLLPESEGAEAVFFGIMTDVSDPGSVPWVTADVGERLELLVEHSPDGIIVHQDGIIVYANPAAMRFAGVKSLSEALGKPMTFFLNPADIGPIVARLAQLNEPGDAVKGSEVTIVHPDGEHFVVDIVSVRTTWGGKPAYQVILRDVSERKRAEEEAQARMAIERRYSAAVAALEEGVVVIDRDGGVAATNDSAVRILGRRLDGGRGDAIFTGGGPAQTNDALPFAAEDLPLAVALSRHEGSTDVVIGVHDEHGVEQWLSVSSRPIDDADDHDAGAVVCSVSDITERKLMLDRLAWEARNDPLTSLANRSGFLAAVEGALETRDVERDGLVMFFFDLDRFKLVNDSLGHAVGDEVLKTMAQRLRTAMPRVVSLSRLHGDEFAALETGVPDTDAALHRAEELRSILSRPVQLSTGRTLTVTPSIGLVRLADVGREASEVLQDADMAMLQAKTRGRGRVAIFDAGLREEVGSRLELEHDLRAAVENGELRLEYQPLASMANGRVLGLEALVRWEHPRRGLLLPGRFVGLAEESELIIALGQWVLEAGCAQMARWRAMYPEANDSFLAVNVSPRQFDGSQLMPAVRGALEKSGLPPGALMLEITESGIVSDDVRLHGMLGELREFGIRLAIDDFGTGYSSLSYLKRLPVSYLKIDRSFVMGLGTDTEDERIVAAITDLGHGLGLRVIAEGVENRQQRHVARQLGCDLYQGYLLAEPRRPRDIPPFWRPRHVPAQRS